MIVLQSISLGSLERNIHSICAFVDTSVQRKPPLIRGACVCRLTGRHVKGGQALHQGGQTEGPVTGHRQSAQPSFGQLTILIAPDEVPSLFDLILA